MNEAKVITDLEEINRLNQEITKLKEEVKYWQNQVNDYSKYKVAFATLVETLKRGK